MKKNFTQIFNLFKKPYTVFVLIVLALAAFNCYLWWQPAIKTYLRDNRLEAKFDQWWKNEGAARFESVGLSPTEALYNEELALYKNKFYDENPPIIPEERIKKMKSDFRTWWETGGKLSYVVQQNLNPNENLYQRELDKWVHGYTQTLIQYKLFIIPQESKPYQYLTYWLQFPKMSALLLFSGFFLFTTFFLHRRWGTLQTLGVFFGSLIFGGITFNIVLPLTYFSRYADSPYMGTSLALAVLLGAAAVGREKNAVPKIIVILSAVGLFLELLSNWFFYPGQYGLVCFLVPVFFGLGILLGKKMPPRRKSKKELTRERLEAKLQENIDVIGKRKEQVREDLEKGFYMGKHAEYQGAASKLTLGLSGLLQENPLDFELLEKTVTQMTDPHFYVEIPGYQWLEWGSAANNKDLPELAIMLLEKALSEEDEAAFARKALLLLGEIRLQHKISIQDGRKNLEKVIELKDGDPLAERAKILLRKF